MNKVANGREVAQLNKKTQRIEHEERQRQREFQRWSSKVKSTKSSLQLLLRGCCHCSEQILWGGVITRLGYVEEGMVDKGWRWGTANS